MTEEAKPAFDKWVETPGVTKFDDIDRKGMQQLADQAAKLPKGSAMLAPRPLPGAGRKKWHPVMGWVDVDAELPAAAPPPDLEARLAPVREQQAVMVAAEKARVDAEEAERTRLARIEARLAQLEEERQP